MWIALAAIVIVIATLILVLGTIRHQPTSSVALIQPPMTVLFAPNAAGALFRLHPNPVAQAVGQITSAQIAEAIGRTADGQWLLLKLNTPRPTNGWVRLADGYLRQGRMQALPHVPQSIAEEKYP